MAVMLCELIFPPVLLLFCLQLSFEEKVFSHLLSPSVKPIP